MSTKIASMYAEISAKDTLTPQLARGKGALTEFGGGVKAGILQLAGFASAAALGGIAIGKTVDFVKDSVRAFTGYAAQVRTISELTKQSTEDTSRLIQVVDDYKLGVEDLTAASRVLSKEGFSLNIDTIAKLSDQYLQLNTGAERQEFLTKNLGRASAEWTLILAQGSDTIREQSGLVEHSLILTQAQIDKAREYETKLDGLQDAWQGFKVNAGELTLPVVIKVLTAANQVTQIGGMFQQLEKNAVTGSASYKDYTDTMHGFFKSLSFGEEFILATTTDLSIMTKAEYDAAKATEHFDNATGSATPGMIRYSQSIAAAVPSLEELAAAEDAARLASAARTDYLGSIISYAGQWQQGQEDIASATEDVAAAEAEVARLRKIGYAEWGKTLTGANGKLDEAKTKLEEVRVASQMATNEMIAGFLQTQLTVDGTFTKDDMEKVLDYRLAMGLLTTEAYHAAQEALRIATNLAAIPADITSNIYLNTIERRQREGYFGEGGGGGAGGGYSNNAVGGRLGGHWAEVGEEGTEGVSPSGEVIPHEKWERMKRAGLKPEGNYGKGTIYYGSAADPEPDPRQYNPLSMARDPWNYNTLPGKYPGDINNPSSWTTGGSGGSGGSGSSTTTSLIQTAISSASAASAQSVQAEMTISSAAATIEDSGRRQAQETQNQTAQNNAGNAAITAELKNVRALLERQGVQMPKSIAAAVERRVSA